VNLARLPCLTGRERERERKGKKRLVELKIKHTGALGKGENRGKGT